MNPEAIPATVIFVIALVDGLRNTYLLNRTYQGISKWIAPPRRILGRSFVIVSILVVIAVGWLGFLSVRRLLGFEALEWSFIVSYLVSIPVLFIPRGLRYVWERLR